jgi:hypothetical protein
MTKVCGACGKKETAKELFEFQCPLCVAEERDDEGFFCNQECFAKVWLQHRDTVHPSAVARVSTKKKEKRDEEEKKAKKEKAEAKRAAKRGREDGDDEGSNEKQTAQQLADRYIQTWPMLKKGSTTCTAVQSKGKAHSQGHADLDDGVRMVAEPLKAETGKWEYIAFALDRIRTLRQKQNSTQRVVLVGGTAATCGAIAWVARTVFGLTPLLIVSKADSEAVKGKKMTSSVDSIEKELSTSLAFNRSSSSSTSTNDILIVSDELFSSEADEDEEGDAEPKEAKVAGAGAKSQGVLNPTDWTQGAILVTLPDVKHPAGYQGLNTRATFLVNQNDARCGEDKDLGKVTHQFEANGFLAPAVPSTAALQTFEVKYPAEVAADPFLLTSATVAGPLNNELSSLLANGQYERAAQAFILLLLNRPTKAESCLRNALLLSWGAYNGDPVEHHHILAALLRYICAEANSKLAGEELARANSIASRVIARTAELLVPLSALPLPAANHNIVLHATICALFPLLKAEVVDTLGRAWNLSRIVCGWSALKDKEVPVRDITERLKHRCLPRLGQFRLTFVWCLMMILRAETSVTLYGFKDVEERLRWSTSSLLRGEIGDMVEFLKDCDLLRTRAENAKTSVSALARASHLKTTQADAKKGVVAAADYADIVRPKDLSTNQTAKKAARSTLATRLPLTELPLSGTKRRHKESLAEIAREEILSAMPSKPLPMYVGDVGNLIGPWTKFNAKYEGALPTSLLLFLQSQPDHFHVVGNIVTRLKASNTQPVKIRFDNANDDDEDDTDDEREKRKEKKKLANLLTGTKTKLDKETHKKIAKSGKARRALVKKLRNQARFNKNHKSFDPESKVPGYVKRGPRKVSGRGKKANIRSWKRQ